MHAPEPSVRIRSALARLRPALPVLAALAFLAVIEGGLGIVRHASFLHVDGPLLAVARRIYLEKRNTLQFLPTCARHAQWTSYTLKRGECEFVNDEFRTVVRGNRLGLRDDDASLVAPELIVLGDSYAMGWGVEQEETFEAILGRTLAVPSLNASMSSYGTVRELRTLARLDRSELRYLIVQYSGNDDGENIEYATGGSRLQTMTADNYAQLVGVHARRTSYYPGDYLRTVIQHTATGIAPGRPAAGREPTAVQDQTDDPQTVRGVRAFLHVLRTSPVDLTGVRIIVLTIAATEGFATLLEEASLAADEPEYIRALTVVDLSRVLQEEHFFRLDDHLRPSGHAAIAAHVRPLLGG